MKDLLHVALNDQKIIVGIAIEKKKRKGFQEWLEAKLHIKPNQIPGRTVLKFSIGSIIFYYSKETPLVSLEMYVEQLKKTTNINVSSSCKDLNERFPKIIEDIYTKLQNIEYVNSSDDPLRNWPADSSVVNKREPSPSSIRWNEFVREKSLKSFGTKFIPFEL